MVCGYSTSTAPGALAEYLYMGAQDNGSFVTDVAPATKPTWFNRNYGDVFDISASANHVVFTRLAAWSLNVADLDLTSGANATWPGNLRGFQSLDSIDSFGPDDFAIVTSTGIHITQNITATPVVWTPLGAASSPTGACAVLASVQAGKPTFIAKAGGCNGDRPGSLWKFEGTGGGSWQQITRNGQSEFGVYAVDPKRPNRIFASDLAGGKVAMVLSTTGGATWKPLPALDALMIGHGAFRAFNRIGPTDFTSFNGYPQPTLVAFDPEDSDIIVAGGADSGHFISTDGGRIWELATDPLTPGISGYPHLPRPRHAYFDHETGDPQTVNLYIGTQGRGAWRINFRKFEPKFEYAAKIVCGIQRDPENLRLAQGLYASAINIRNPATTAVEFDKSLALTFPPKEQKAGQIIPIARDKLPSGEALEVDCEDLKAKAFPDGFPTPYIKGFVVIRSTASLEIIAVYTSADLVTRMGSESHVRHSSIDIERIFERALGPVTVTLSDLIPVNNGSPESGPFCVLKTTKQGTDLVVTIRNQGPGQAGTSTTEVDFLRSGASYAKVSQPLNGLLPGQETDLQFRLPQGWLTEGANDFKIAADHLMVVLETDDNNNVGNGQCRRVD